MIKQLRLTALKSMIQAFPIELVDKAHRHALSIHGSSWMKHYGTTDTVSKELMHYETVFTYLKEAI